MPDSSVDSLDDQHVVARSRSVGLYVVADTPRATLQPAVRAEKRSDPRLLRPRMPIRTKSFPAERAQPHRIREPAHTSLGSVVAARCFSNIDATAVRAAQQTYDCPLLFQGYEVADRRGGLSAVGDGDAVNDQGVGRLIA